MKVVQRRAEQHLVKGCMKKECIMVGGCYSVSSGMNILVEKIREELYGLKEQLEELEATE